MSLVPLLALPFCIHKVVCMHQNQVCQIGIMVINTFYTGMEGYVHC